MIHNSDEVVDQLFLTFLLIDQLSHYKAIKNNYLVNNFHNSMFLEISYVFLLLSV